MRREYFSLKISNVAWVDEGNDPCKPTITIACEGDATTLRERLRGPDGEPLTASEVDVTFRFLEPTDTPDADGVVGVTDRVTGHYVLELNVDADDFLRFVTAARRYGEHTDDTARYETVVAVDGEPVLTVEKRTLLIYSAEGELLRRHSLIPSGVEI